MTAVEEVLIPISRFFYDDAGPHIVGVTTSDRDFRGTTLAPQESAGYTGRSAPRAVAPVATTPAATARYTPARGRELHDLLGTSIAQLGGVSGGTRKTPAPPPPVSIDTLLYRGRAALDRALEIRAAARITGQAPTTDTIDELLDLIGLAAED
jgi:hypothetical protein